MIEDEDFPDHEMEWDTDAIPNAAEPVEIKETQKRNNLSKDKAAIFWRGVFASEVGRREMWGILQATHAFEERFACGPNGFPQVEATWFHAGEQALGLRLYRSWMKLDRAGVFLMHDENDPHFMKPKKVRKANKDPYEE